MVYIIDQIHPGLYPLINLVIFISLTPLIYHIFRRIKLEKYLGLWVSGGFLISLIYALLYLPEIARSGPILISVTYPTISSTLVIDLLGFIFIIIFLLISLSAALHSVNYMERDHHLGSYFMLMLLMTTGLVGLSYAYDLFTFFVVWELMAISSYILVAFRYHLDEPVEAGVKYLVMSGTGSLIMLYGLSYAYGFTGSFNGIVLAKTFSNMPVIPLTLTLSLIMIGFGVKAAFFPFWTWLPDAHPAAPSPISAMLSGIVIKAGIMGIIRFIIPSSVLISSGLGLTMAVIAALTMTVANLLALLQDDIKRLLAYSSITNIGFILIGISSAIYGEKIAGISSSILHVFTHALGKGLAFLAVGSIIYVLETRSIKEMEGLGRKMPFTTTALIISLLSLAGMPPLPGFWSKWFLIFSAIKAKLYGLAILGVINSVLAVIFYLWLLQRLFFGEQTEKVEVEGREAPKWILFSLAMLVTIMIIIGFYPGPLYTVIMNAVKNFITFLISY